VRYFAGLSVIGLLVVVVIIAVGQTSATEHVLGSSTTGPGSVGYGGTAPIAEAHAAVSATAFQPLFAEAEAALAGGTPATVTALTHDLAANEPEDHVGRRLSAGGIVLSLSDHHAVVTLCQRPRSAVFVCQSEHIIIRQRGSQAVATTLRQARREALIGLSQPSRPTTPESPIQQAKALAGSGY
jgi:hypothetical protein